MILKFFGKLISTEDIYWISDIQETFHSSRPRTGCYDFEHEKPFYFYYTVTNYKGPAIEILQDAFYYPKKLFTAQDIQYIEHNNGRAPEIAERLADEYRKTAAYKLQREEVERTRNELIKHWSNSQPTIPSIEFKTKNE